MSQTRAVSPRTAQFGCKEDDLSPKGGWKLAAGARTPTKGGALKLAGME
jgi:hypothetical protein